MSASQPFTVGLIQEAVSPDVATNVNDAIAKIRQAHAQGAQIICLQELFNCQYFCKAQKGERFELAEPIPGPTVTAMEAIATATTLQREGRIFSVGLAQINVGNLRRLGLTIPEAFDACRNLGAMQTVLEECFDRAGAGTSQRELRRALSCYYSGNFATGFRHGYVDRVVRAARPVSAGVRAPP